MSELQLQKYFGMIAPQRTNHRNPINPFVDCLMRWLKGILKLSDRGNSKLPLREFFFNLTKSQKKILLRKIGNHSLQTVFSISQESNTTVFAHRFFALGQSYLREGKLDLAASVFSHLISEGGHSGIPLPIIQQAQLQIDILSGTAPIAQQSEFIAHQTIQGLFHPATWMGLGAGMGFYRLGKASALSFLLSGPGRGWVTTRIGATIASVFTGLIFEGYGFSLASNWGHHLAGTNIDKSYFPTLREVASSYVVLGSMRGVSSLAGYLVGAHPATMIAASAKGARATLREIYRSMVVHGGTLGGILLGHGIEKYFALRDPQPFNRTFAESLSLMIQFGMMNQLSPFILGKSFYRYLERLDQKSVRLLHRGGLDKIKFPTLGLNPRLAWESAGKVVEFPSKYSHIFLSEIFRKKNKPSTKNSFTRKNRSNIQKWTKRAVERQISRMKSIHKNLGDPEWIQNNRPSGGDEEKWILEVYRREVLKKIEFFIERSKENEIFRTTKLLKAMLDFPKNPQTPSTLYLINSIDRLVDLNSKDLKDPRFNFPRLEKILGAKRGGSITNLTSMEVYSLFKGIRFAHQNDKIFHFAEMLNMAEDIDGVKEFIQFYQLHDCLTSGEQTFFWYRFLPSKNLNRKEYFLISTYFDAMRSFFEQKTAGMIRRRLRKIRVQEGSPLLLKIGIPFLKKSLPKNAKDYVSAEFIQAIQHLETRAGYQDLPMDLPSNRTRQLLLDLAILIGAPKMFDTVTGKQVFDEVNLPKKLAQKLPELAEPLRTIAAARILIEKKHPEYNVRLMVVQLLGSWLRNLPYLEIHHLFLQNLRGFFKDPVLSVQIIAREQAISLLDKLSESDAQFLWNEMKVPENFLKAAKKRNFYAIILTFRFATLGWKYFSPSEKEKIANIALDTFYWVIKERSAATQGGVTDQLATNIAIFLTQHKNDLSPSLRIKIGSSAFIAKVLLKHLPLMTDATISIAHLLEIGDEEVRRVFENWAWSKLEQKEYPLNIAFSISVILTSLFNNDPAGDLVRSKRWNVYNHLLRWVVHERSDMRLIGRETLHEIIKKMPRAEIYQVYVRLISLKNSDLSETIKQEIDQLMAKVVLEKAH